MRLLPIPAIAILIVFIPQDSRAVKRILNGARTLHVGGSVTMPWGPKKPKDPKSEIIRVSIDSNENEAENGDSYHPRVSGDGTRIVFQSTATNLAPGDGSGNSDIFMRDTETGETTLISIGELGIPSTGHSFNGSISDDGKMIAFEAFAQDIDTTFGSNNFAQIYVRDLSRSDFPFTTVLSVGPTGELGNQNSTVPIISGDGRYVFFDSYASNLVSDLQTVGVRNIYRVEIETGDIELVTKSFSSGPLENIAAFGSSYVGLQVSRDGRYVAFDSAAPDHIAPGLDQNSKKDVFVRDMLLGSTSRVSVDSFGQEGTGSSKFPSISPDGRYVSFSSYSDLEPPSQSGFIQMYRHFLPTGETKLISRSESSLPGNEASLLGSVNDNGDVVFTSRATDFDLQSQVQDSNGTNDVFLYSESISDISLISVNPSSPSQTGNGISTAPKFSQDQSTIVFWSDANSLVSHDQNQHSDVFLIRF